MGRHKLPYKMKKPNPHHRYWRYVLSTDPKQCEISTRTKVKYEAERIAKEAYQKELERQAKGMTFGDYAKDFFTPTCKLTLRRKASNKPISNTMMNIKRGELLNHLMPYFKDFYLQDITEVIFEDWRLTLPLSNSTKNDITVAMKQILNEAIRDKIIPLNPMQRVEALSKTPQKPREALTDKEVGKIFPSSYDEAIKIWDGHRNYTLMFLLVTSGMRSGEVRALKWADVIWDGCGILITKAIKDKGEIGTVKENKEKFVRLPKKTIGLLKQWKEESQAAEDDDFIFYGRYKDKPLNRTTIRDIFKRGLKQAKIKNTNNLVPHCLRHTFNSFSLSALPSDVVRKFTGHSSEQMSKHYFHMILNQELKATAQYQDKIDEIWA